MVFQGLGDPEPSEPGLSKSKGDACSPGKELRIHGKAPFHPKVFMVFDARAILVPSISVNIRQYPSISIQYISSII